MTKNKPDFTYFIPCDIQKAVNEEGKEVMRFAGIASTPDIDTDGESIDPNGYILDYFNHQGTVNWAHLTKDNPLAIIGEPIKAEIRPEGLYVEVELYSDNPLAKAVYKLGQVLEKNSSKRRLGFSIEGKALQRDPFNKKRITKTLLSGIAITPTPRNKATSATIMKGLGISDLSFEKIQEDLNSEDIDLLKKGLNNTEKSKLNKKNKKNLKKGAVYAKIFNEIPNCNKHQANKICQIVENLMSKKNNQPTDLDDALKKAMDMLGTENVGSQFDPELLKSIKSCLFDGLSSDQVIKSLESDFQKSEIVEAMTFLEKGMPGSKMKKAEDDEDEDEEDEDEDEEDEDDEEMSDKEMSHMKKALQIKEKEVNDLRKALEAKSNVAPSRSKGEDVLQKSLDSLSKSISENNDKVYGKVTSAIDVLVKGFKIEIGSLVDTIDSLQQKLDSSTEEIEELKKSLDEAPVYSKAAVRGSYRNPASMASDGGKSDNTLSVSRDKRQILNLIDSKINYNDLQKGGVDAQLAKAMQMYESSNVLDPQTANLLKKDGYSFVN